MKTIFIIGAGLSTTSMIDYLLEKAITYNWHVIVGDMSLEVAQRKVGTHPKGEAIEFDISNEMLRIEQIGRADVVISMLPSFLHPIAAKTCLELKKHMFSASYVSKEFKKMDKAVRKEGLLFLNEMGVDPGIDHMSAMKVINNIKKLGGKMTAFRSFTGGLIAPKYDNNPWNYKFTWNPRNVVLAGQGTAKVIDNGCYKYIPYHQLFKRTERVDVLQYGEFEGYPNRDSLMYRELYSLENIPTMIRGTLRRPGYCKAWDIFVQLGVTDDSFSIKNSETLTYREFFETFLEADSNLTMEQRFAKLFNLEKNSTILYKLRWLGVFDDKIIGLKNATPAQILQKLLVEKWKLDEDDKDMIAMQHQFEYEIDGKIHGIKSSMVYEGKDSVQTAMAITVGIPVAIAVKLFLTGDIKLAGVRTPVHKIVYEPVLKELEEFDIRFIEEEYVVE